MTNVYKQINLWSGDHTNTTVLHKDSLYKLTGAKS